MKIRSLKLNIHQLVSLLMVILTFILSFPTVATAQYDDSVEAAKRDAKADAKADTNEFLWFATTCGVSIGTLVIAGLIIEHHLDETGSAYYSQVEAAESAIARVDEIVVTAALLPYSVGTGAIWGIGKFYQLSPPTARFMGKSPQYIQAYTTAYKEQKVNTRSNWSLLGLVVGSAVGLAYIFLILE